MASPNERSVLVVDDDEHVLAAYRRAYERSWKVFACSTLDEAFEIVKHHRFEAAVVDLHLATASTIALVRELRATDPHLPIALVSGYLTTESTVVAVQAGATIVLDKPVNPREIMRRLQEGVPADVDIGETPTLEDAIESHIARVYSDCNGNISETARRLGIYRSSLQRRLRKNVLKRIS